MSSDSSLSSVSSEARRVPSSEARRVSSSEARRVSMRDHARRFRRAQRVQEQLLEDQLLRDQQQYTFHDYLIELRPATETYVVSNGQHGHTSNEESDSSNEDFMYISDTDGQSDGQESDGQESDAMRISGSDSESDVQCEPRPISKGLHIWATQCNVPQITFTLLLQTLNQYLTTNLPLDSRTLLKLPRTVEVREKCGGEYIYLGIESGIVRIISNFRKSFENLNVIKFHLNMDGLPLFKSSGKQMWPILCRIMQFEPFVVALFHGIYKPVPIGDFLEDLLEEVKALETKKISVFNNGNDFKFKFNSFICDAPARQMIKAIISHTGYCSCERCTLRGEYFNNRVCSIIPNENPPRFPPLRSEEKFRNNEYTHHQVAVSPLVYLGINVSCVDDFVLDYMHLVCLGVVRKTLNYLFKKGRRTTPEQRQAVCDRLERLKMPKEFQRQPRSLEFVDRFKATEFRQFLLYTGPVIMKDIIDERKYEHFLLLTKGMIILLDRDDTFRNAHLLSAQRYLVKFVLDAEEIYGKEFISYNTHSLIHLVDDVQRFGCSLNDISAFPFENHLFHLKKGVKNAKNPIAQIIKQIKSTEIANLDQRKLKPKLQIGTNTSDCYFNLKDHGVAIVKNKMGEEYQCHIYPKEVLENYFRPPCDSREFDIFHLKNVNQFRRQTLSKQDLKQKMVGISDTNDGIVLLKLRHL